MRGSAVLILVACLTLVLGCKVDTTDEGDDGEVGGEASVERGGGSGTTSQTPLDPKCAGAPEVVPPEVPYLTNIRQQSYIVGPEGGVFDLTDEPAVTISIPPCAVGEPVRFTYGIQSNNPGTGAAGASVFISFLTIAADRAGNSGYADLRSGDVTITWHDAPTPERAKIWAMGQLGYEERSTTVDGADVRASTPLVTYLGFALGE